MKVRLVSLFIMSAAISVPAQSFTNLAGILNGVNFRIPAQLTTIATNGLVIDVPQSSAFGSETFQAPIQNDGTFGGEDGGFISIDGQGMITVFPSGQEPISMKINSSQDVFIGLANETDDGVPQNSLNLGARAPQSVSGSDLAGNWTLLTMDTPEQLIKMTATNGVLTNLMTWTGNSVFPTGVARIGSGSMTINSDGTLSGFAQDSFTGTYSIGGSGQISVTINSGDSFTMPAFVNSSKDVMFALHRDDEANRQELIVMVKAPSSASVADLKGLWRVTTFSAPGSVFLNRTTNNYITSISLTGEFKKSQSAYYSASLSGFISGLIESPAIGALAVSSGGVGTITFTNNLGEISSHSGYLNASKNLFVVVENDGDSIGITLVTKAPDWPGNQNVGLQSFTGNEIVWAGDTNTILQSADSPGDNWSDISSTLGQNQYNPDPTNPAEFYRVKIQ